MRRIDMNILYARNVPEKRWRVRVHCGGHVCQAEASEPSRSPAFDEPFSVYVPFVPGVLHVELFECGTFFRPAELHARADVPIHCADPSSAESRPLLLRPTLLMERTMAVAEVGITVRLHPPPALRSGGDSSARFNPSAAAKCDTEDQRMLGADEPLPTPSPSLLLHAATKLASATSLESLTGSSGAARSTPAADSIVAAAGAPMLAAVASADDDFVMVSPVQRNAMPRFTAASFGEVDDGDEDGFVILR